MTEKNGLRKTLILFFATGAFSGYSPVAPGTIGTVWGVLISFLISTLSPSPGAAGAAAWVTGAALAAVYFANEAQKILGGNDPKGIVCDEAAGFMAAMFLIPFTALNAILVFILFRIFDILKPFPAGFIDRRCGGGIGIVLDDMAAGIYANIAARVITGFIPTGFIL
ncbi:MAG: phosphatidylglycerophosphatase A [Deltaproteobacteria bacterium]|nr:phosphatidylglycerophosphatase A [Deltaproteobacteria bacterium]